MGGINILFHSSAKFSIPMLLLFFVSYFSLASITIGATLPVGLLVPSILAGCAYGRLFGEILVQWTPFDNIQPGTLALLGGVSFLCGVTRLSISLVAIMLESTNDMSYGLPIIIAVLTAKGVANWVSHAFHEHVSH